MRAPFFYRQTSLWIRQVRLPYISLSACKEGSVACTTVLPPIITQNVTPGTHFHILSPPGDWKTRLDFMVRPRIESGPSKLVGRHHTHGSIKPHNLLRPKENVNLSYKKKSGWLVDLNGNWANKDGIWRKVLENNWSKSPIYHKSSGNVLKNNPPLS